MKNMIANIKTVRTLNLLETSTKRRIKNDSETLEDIKLRREQIKFEDESQIRLDI